MRRMILVLAITAGCAHSVPRALDGANKALVGVDIAMETAKVAIDAATRAQMEACAREAPGEARERCMGQLGRPIAPAAESVGEAYDQAVQALQALERAWAELQPFVDAAKEARTR